MTEIQLLTSRRFLPLFLTQALGAFGDNALRGAIAVLAVFGAGAEEGALVSTMAAAAFTIPFLLFSATAGQMADRFDRTLVARAVKVAELSLMALASWGVLQGSLPILIIALVGMGAHSTVFGPVKYGLLPDLLEPGELKSANGLVEAGTFVSILLGTIAGGTLALGDPWAVPVLLGLSSVVGLGASLMIPRAGNATVSVKVGWNPASATWRVLKTVAADRPSLLAIHGISIFWGVGAVVMAQFPSIAHDVLGADSDGATLLLGIFAVGVAVGSVVAGLGHRTPTTADARRAALAGLVAAAAGAALPFLTPAVGLIDHGSPLSPTALLAQPWAPALLLDLFLIAAAGGAFAVPLYALIQHRAPHAERARVIAAANVVNALYMVAGSGAASAALWLGASPLTVAAWGGASMLGAVACALTADAREIVRSGFRAVLRAFYSVEVRGAEHLTAVDGAAVVAFSHESFIDGILLASFLPGSFRFAVDTTVAGKWWAKPFLALADYVTVDPTSPMAVRVLDRTLVAGDKIAIAPDGRITTTGLPMQTQPTPALLALKAACPVIIVCIAGAKRTIFSRMRGKLPLRLFTRITLSVMPPAHAPSCEGLRPRDRRAMLKTWLETAMRDAVYRGTPHPETLPEALLAVDAQTGALRTAIMDSDGTTLRYRSMIASARVIGECLARRIGADAPAWVPGEERDDGAFELTGSVGVLLPTVSHAATVVFGLAMHRIPASMLNYAAGPLLVRSACDLAKVRTLVTSRRFIEMGGKRLQALIEELQADIEILYLEDVKAGLGWRDRWTWIKTMLAPRRMVPRTARPDDIAAIIFTSGTEGLPKGVALRQRNLMANIHQIASVAAFDRTDTVFNCLPIFHSFGLTAGLLLPVLRGVRTILHPDPRRMSLIPKLIYFLNATVIYGTSTLLGHWGRAADQHTFDKARWVVAGGERLRPEVAAHYADELGVFIREGYGLTEAGPVAALNTRTCHRKGSVGRLLPGIDCRLDQVPGIDSGALLWIRGANIMAGYIRADRPGVVVPLEGGWHNTGDIVRIDEDGFLFIVARHGRFAKPGAEKIDLDLVEKIAQAASADGLHASTFVPDDQRGDRIILVTTSRTLTREGMVAAAKAMGAPDLAVARDVCRVPEIPLLPTGKIDYPAVNRLVTAVEPA